MKERKTVIYTILTVVGLIIIISVKAQMNQSWRYTWEPPYSSYEQQVLFIGFVGIMMLATGVVGLFSVWRQSKQDQEIEQRTGGLKSCPGCGLSISGYVKICPRCGVDILTGKAPVQDFSAQNSPAQNSLAQNVPVQNFYMGKNMAQNSSMSPVQNSPAQKVSVQAPEEEKTVLIKPASDQMEQKAPENQAVRFCTKCGNRIDVDDLFCARCGNKIKRGEESV